MCQQRGRPRSRPVFAVALFSKSAGSVIEREGANPSTPTAHSSMMNVVATFFSAIAAADLRLAAPRVRAEHYLFSLIRE